MKQMTETHVTGESVFVDDIALMKNEVYVSYVGSPVSAGVLKLIDFSEVKKMAGVVGCFTAKDIHHNLWGTIVKDQPILVENKIGYIDEPICIIAAESRAVLEKARKLVKFKIEEKKAVLKLSEAILNKQFLHSPLPFQCGDVSAAFQNSPHILKGEFEIGGQEHFYLESQASIVYPDDASKLRIISSSQHPTETQHLVAEAVGLPFHHVVCEVKRMGGAFGGKESQAAPFAAMAAVVAHQLKRPARIVLSKDDDMKVTGKRHPFINYYEVAFNDEGKILGLKVKLYADGGAYTDLSPSIIDRAMFHVDGSYFIENALIEAWVCKTNTHSNTAFRGFGGPQGNLTIENIIEEMALYLKKEAAEIRQINLYQKTERNQTPYGQLVENNLLPDLYEKLIKTSEYNKRRKEINLFNSKQTGQIKGLAMTGCKFGISFTARFLNQGNALVNIHRDGTVQVSTGATEMGQGVNVKIQHVVSRAFGIPLDDIHVTTTSTEKNANTSPTAASSGSDINGAAAQVACDKILKRLKQVALFHFSEKKLSLAEEIEVTDFSNEEHLDIQFKDSQVLFKNKSLSWKELIQKTYLNRISISDYGHFKTTGLAFDRVKGFGNAFKYFTTGFAVSEVLIDSYTGDTKILRSDLLMDIGKSMDQGIDLGQITGGFIQGVGWMMSEKLYYNEKGSLISHSPTTYKIPNIQDIPRDFRFDILENNLNAKNNILASKAVGEPPLLLGASVFMAIKNALSYFSKNKQVQLSVPATPETILMELTKYEL
jgi:xanthine dehydrogenase large subunit